MNCGDGFGSGFTFWLVLTLFLRFTEGKLSPGEVDFCRKNEFAEYAYSGVEQVIDLGGLDGFLIVRGHLGHCIHRISLDLSPQPSPEDTGLCSHVLTLLQKEIYTHQASANMRFTLLINRTVFYATIDSEAVKTKELTKLSQPVLIDFAVPNFNQWVNAYLRDYKIRSVGLFKQSFATTLPSALIFEDNPQGYIELHWIKCDGHKLSSCKKQSEIKFNAPQLKAVYIADQSSPTTLHIILFYNKYYGKALFDTTNRQLKRVFPSLPMQRVFGCPINLCWWPLIDDIEIVPKLGTLYYVLYQSGWEWWYELGTNQAPEVNKSIYMPQQDLVIKAMFRNPETGLITVLAKRAKSQVLQVLERNATTKLFESTEWTIVHRHGRWNMKAATVVGNQLMALATNDFNIKLFYLTRTANKKEYKESLVIPIPLKTASGMFYHELSGTLNIVSGAFLYIFERHYQLESSRCTIVPFARYFNCTDQYYTKDSMLGKSWANYLQLIQQNHNGELEFWRCRLLPNFRWTNGSIPWDVTRTTTESTSVTITKDTTPAYPFPRKVLFITLFVIAIAAGFMIGTMVLRCCYLRCGGNKVDNFESRNVNKYVPGVKERWLEVMSPSRKYARPRPQLSPVVNFGPLSTSTNAATSELSTSPISVSTTKSISTTPISRSVLQPKKPTMQSLVPKKKPSSKSTCSSTKMKIPGASTTDSPFA